MKPTIKNLSAFALMGLLFVGCTTTHSDSCCDSTGTKCAVKVSDYEYKTVRLSPNTTTFDSDLNNSSKGGWKLITTSPEAPSGGYIYYTFERPKQ